MKYKISITDKEIYEIISLLTYNIEYARESLRMTPTDSDYFISLCKLIELNACEKGKWENLIEDAGKPRQR